MEKYKIYNISDANCSFCNRENKGVIQIKNWYIQLDGEPKRFLFKPVVASKRKRWYYTI